MKDNKQLLQDLLVREGYNHMPGATQEPIIDGYEVAIDVLRMVQLFVNNPEPSESLVESNTMTEVSYLLSQAIGKLKGIA